MPKVVGVKFKKSSRVYYFESGEFEYKDGIPVIVETARGTEMGYITMLPTIVDEDKIVAPLKPIVRLATQKDVEQIEKLEEKRIEALKISAQKIADSNLEMKLTDCEYTFDGTKLIIYFTADGRVDFRDLVKDLASAFHVRIELRQIGARDECKMLGGLGPCGRPCCCANHMPDYAHVTIKMAKNQGLSLNPTKISGLCGRLMCCLSYENEVYAEANKILPSIGDKITTPDGKEGVVVALHHLKGSVRVKIQDGEKISFADVNVNDGCLSCPCKKSVEEDNEEVIEEVLQETIEEEVKVEEKVESNGEEQENTEEKKDKHHFKKKHKHKHHNGGENKTQQNVEQKPQNNENKSNEQGENKPNKPFFKHKKKHFHKKHKGNGQGNGANAQN